MNEIHKMLQWFSLKLLAQFYELLHHISWILYTFLFFPPYVLNLGSSVRSFPVERLMKCSGPGAKGEVVPCWDFSLAHWAHYSHTGYITQSVAGTHTHTHRPSTGLDNIRAGWLGRNHSCIYSCPNGWYTAVHVSVLLEGPPLTCCYIMLACVLFGSVWYSVVE